MGTRAPRPFQFHKGAIETASLYHHAGRTTPFQFHKGAIETTHLLDNAIRDGLFQFHKGAIETLAVSRQRGTCQLSIP